VDLTSPLAAVRHHLAMQAQDWKASRWAVGSRVPGSVDADVLRAFDQGAIVRSWPMRGTVHVMEARELQWMLDLMGVRALSGVQRRWEMLGITEVMLEQAREVAMELLRGGGRCTRAELKDALEAAGLDLAGQRAYHTVWYLSQTGTLVQGPTRDGQQELVLLSEWVPHPRKLSREESLAELGRRYLLARGPASLADLEHWSKLTKRDCRAAFEANADDLVELTRAGTTLYMLRERFEILSAAPHSACQTSHVAALAAFDEHLLGYRVRDDVLDPAHANLVDPGRNGVFRWTIVVEGNVVATWTRTPRAQYVRVDVTPFTRVAKRHHRAVSAALDRWGAFAGTTVKVSGF